MFDFFDYDFKRYNYTLLLVVTLLSFAGAYFVMCASGTDAGMSMFRKQLIGMFLGLFMAVGISLIDYHLICQFTVVYYIVVTPMVAATKYSPWGTDLGTKSFRWINVFGIKFQPSEVCKVMLILALAAFFTKFKKRINRVPTILLAITIMMVPTFFILTQSDLSSSVVIMFVFAMMIFFAGLSYKIILPALAAGVPLFFIVYWYIQQPNQKLLNPYQVERIIGFKHPDLYASETMWQQNQSVTAISAGKLLGKIFTDNPVRAYRKVGVNESDFIFSVIGEEGGFLGSLLIIALLAIVVIIALMTAKNASDRLGMLICVGIASMFAFQTFANIGVATRMLPNTGLPLPFLSAGLSSMLSSMISIGLLLNIGLQSRVRSDGFSMMNQ
ncbi:MAG: FtsW/RodA/SpoVE family cell cycle protein [Lachnospiraceae bacterium]|nr:FtsW/RodA/SpoVE family cell cycle protein [Lachnospiraceae bacterium]